MPSSDVAKCCATSRSAASKNDGARLISVSSPSAVPCSSRDGVMKSLESRKISSPVSSVATITVLVLARHAGHRLALPRARRDDLDAAGDVGQRDDQQPVPRPRVLVQAGVLVGLEHHRQFGCAIEELLVVGGQQRTGAVGRRAGEPVGAQLDQQPVPVHRQRGVGGRVDADELTRTQFVHLLVEEVDGAVQQRPLEAGRAVHRRRHDHVAGRPGEHGRRLAQRLAASPPLDDPRIARLRHRARSEVGTHQHRVGVLPGHAATSPPAARSRRRRIPLSPCRIRAPRPRRTRRAKADQRSA